MKNASENKSRYNKYSSYMKEKYSEKVYKIPVNLDVTCPNRDGTLGVNGCIFCSSVGAGFECHESSMPASGQVRLNIEKISKGYGANRFVIYFQNFTNTYLSVEKLCSEMREAVAAAEGRAVEVSVSTRPDCINSKYVSRLKSLCDELGVELTLELGLQSVNYHTLTRINRGHTLAEFIDAALVLRDAGIRYCVHMIIGFPWEDMTDAVEGAKVLSALRVPQVKIHSLYVLKGTVLGDMYERNEIDMISVEEYVERVVEFVRHMSPDAVFERFLGRAPKEDSLFCNWGMNWFRIMDMMDARLVELDAYQGDKCDYLDGKAIKTV